MRWRAKFKGTRFDPKYHGHPWVIDLSFNLNSYLIRLSAHRMEERRRDREREGGQIFRARETAISLLFDAFKAPAIGAL